MAPLRTLSALAGLLGAACTSSFNPDNEHHVTGSQTWPTGISLPGHGALIVHQRHGQVGEHSAGVHRAQRLESQQGKPLTPWLTTTPLVDGSGKPRVKVVSAERIFVFDPGEALDSRDQQPHLAKGWYLLGARGPTGDRCDDVLLYDDGSYETVVTDTATLTVRAHNRDGAPCGELRAVPGSVRPAGFGRWRVARPAGNQQDDQAVVLDDALQVRGRIVELAREPGDYVDLTPTQPQAWLWGLDDTRAVVSPGREPTAGPWQWVKPLISAGCVTLLLGEANGERYTLVQPTLGGSRVLLAGVGFALAQSRRVPAEYADLTWGAEVPVMLAGTKTDAGESYVLFAQIEGLLRGPFAAATSEAATAAMWAGLAPIAQARRVALAEARRQQEEAATRQRAALQASVDANRARLVAADRQQIAYLEAIKKGDLAAAGRAIAAMNAALAEFFVPQGHADSEHLANERRFADVYRYDWELRRPDRTLSGLVAIADALLYQGGNLYARYCREVVHLMAQADTIERPTYDTLYRTSYGFDTYGKKWLDWHYQRLEQREARARYDAYLAAGRFDDAHGIAYKLNFVDYVNHLQTVAKGRVPEGELEALMRHAVQIAPTPALRQKLEQAHESQWRDMVAADAREQRERFRKMDEEAARARAAATLAEQARLHEMKMESLRQGFVWR